MEPPVQGQIERPPRWISESLKPGAEIETRETDGLVAELGRMYPRPGGNGCAGEHMVEERSAAAMIKRAIQDRACLRGTHATFRVHFAPHVLGRDRQGRQVVVAFEYGGVTTGQAHWMWFQVDHLRGLHRTGDPWRTGSVESRPQFNLTEIEVSADNSWSCGRSR